MTVSYPCPDCRDRPGVGCLGVFLAVCVALWLFQSPPPAPPVVVVDRAALAAVAGCPAVEPAACCRPR